MKLKYIFEALHISPDLSTSDEIAEICQLILLAQDLSCVAASTLVACFSDGPLSDGDIPSKAGRDELVRLGLVSAVIVKGHEGYNACTQKGYWVNQVLSARPANKEIVVDRVGGLNYILLDQVGLGDRPTPCAGQIWREISSGYKCKVVKVQLDLVSYVASQSYDSEKIFTKYDYEFIREFTLVSEARNNEQA
jgi:hypothetical protein